MDSVRIVRSVECGDNDDCPKIERSEGGGFHVTGTDVPDDSLPPHERKVWVPDELLPELSRLLMQTAEDPLAGDPMEAKLALARFIVRRAHGDEAAQQAEEHFTRVVRQGEAPEDVLELALPEGDPVHLPRLLTEQLGVSSTSEARRLIAQGGVKLNGEPVAELDVPRARLEGALLQAGKRRFVRFAPV